MNNIKKITTLISIIAFTSCTNLVNNNSLKNIKDILGIDKKETIKDEEIITDLYLGDKFNEEEAILTSENVGKYLDIVKERLRNSEKRIKNDMDNDYKVYVGEFLVIPSGDATNAKLNNFTKNTTARVNIDNGNLFFRTIYRGNYGVFMYQGSNLIRKINIQALTKFKFSESNIYDIITENLEKNNKTLEDALSLYKIYYPNGKNIRKVSCYLLNYGYKIQNMSLINEALDMLKTEIENLNDEEKILLLKGATIVNKDIYIPSNIYKTTNEELIKELSSYLKNKKVLDKRDVVFLEKASEKEDTNEKNSILNKVSSWYKNNGNFAKVKEISEKTAEEKIENLYEIAIKNMNTNPRLAISNFKKSLLEEKNENRRAETYYNIANSYLKLGNKFEAIKYLNLIRQEFSNNAEWVNRSQLLINTIK